MEPKSRISRQDKEECIDRLVEAYPKAFFIEPRQRVPLKKDIAADIARDGFPAGSELINAAMDWYQSHFGYQKCLQAGVLRVDLHGKGVRAVTENEERAARKKVAEINEQRNEQATLAKPMNPVRILTQLHTEKRISDDMVKKLDAPPLKDKKGHSADFDEGFLAGYDAGYSAGYGEGYEAGEAVAGVQEMRNQQRLKALVEAKAVAAQ